MEPPRAREYVDERLIALLRERGRRPWLPVVVEQVRPEVTYDLRARVLRPGLPPMKARFGGDDAPDALHYAAYDRADRIVGVVAVLPEATPAGLPGRRLRGMAVHPDERSAGVGAALLARVFDGVARLDETLLWCKARTPARRFYEQSGFVAVGDEWLDPDFGPHIEMHRAVDASDRIAIPNEDV